MSSTLLLLAIFATFRLSYLIIYERGPWSLAERLRSWVVGRYGPKSWQGEGIQCILCVSFWLALPWATLALWGSGILTPLLLLVAWQGVAGACLALNAWLIRR